MKQIIREELLNPNGWKGIYRRQDLTPNEAEIAVQCGHRWNWWKVLRIHEPEARIADMKAWVKGSPDGQRLAYRKSGRGRKAAAVRISATTGNVVVEYGGVLS